MFFHEFKYTFLSLARSKADLAWTLCFPILLGTMFFFAFSSLYETDELFSSVPVAVVETGNELSSAFKNTADGLTSENGEKILTITYTGEKQAQMLLKEKKIYGIITISDMASLVISDEATQSDPVSVSILDSFVKQFNLNAKRISSLTRDNPIKLSAALDLLSKELSYQKEIPLSGSNMDVTVQYFFNLVAMACLYAYSGGQNAALRKQANLSAVGERICISPVNRLISALASFLATLLLQYLILCICIFYYIFVLKVDFGSGNAVYILCALLAGCITGISYGYFIGSIGHMSQNIKIAISICPIMLCCFLSGLMTSDMRMLVEQKAPLLNRINPAALISDCFYSLFIYETHTRYYKDILSLLAISCIFLLAGFFITRREKYASL